MIHIRQLNNSQIAISWDAVSGAVDYKVTITGLGAKDTHVYEAVTGTNAYIQSSLVIGSYYSVLVQYKDGLGNYSNIEPSFICRVGNGGTGVVIVWATEMSYYQSITSGSIQTTATINSDGNILIDLPSFASTDLSYYVCYQLGSPYEETQWGSHLFPISNDTKLGLSVLSSSLTEPNTSIELTFYPFRG